MIRRNSRQRGALALALEHQIVIKQSGERTNFMTKTTTEGDQMDFEAAKQLCRSLPGCTEDIKWGADLVFSVGDKMFAVTGNEAPAAGISFKVDDERFLELTDRPGIIPAPYLARAKWVYVQADAQLGDAEAAQLLRRSWELVLGKLTKKLQREILAAAGEPAAQG
jgi:predicted DNA-binding protein (MmcQ/YjbR family)